MLKTYRYRLYPTDNQEQLLNKHLGSTRFIFNLALETKISAYKSNKINLSRYDLQKQLIELKQEAIWLKEINSQSIQYSLLQLDNSFKNFFKGAGFPKFKKKRNKSTFHVPQSTKIINNELFIPKFKEGIKIIVDRKYKGDIRSTSITKTPTNKYYANILCETGEKIPEKIKSNNIIGLDMGLNDFITLNSGIKIPNIRTLNNSKVNHLHKLISKREYKSNRRYKLQLRLNKIYEKAVNKKQDFMHKLSNEITNHYDIIVIEDLNIKGMMKNHNLAKSIGEAGWNKFIRMLDYKCLWKGKTLVKADRFFPSSKTCSVCGNKYVDLSLKERQWTCSVCGTTHDRDINAALNIKKWLVERQCQDVERSSVDERSMDHKKHLIFEALTTLH